MLVSALAALSGAVRAQQTSDVPHAIGFDAGPFVLAPSLTTGYSYDSNVYQNSVTLNPQPDEVRTLQPALLLTLPFSNSAFKFTDTYKYVDYQVTPQDNGKASNDANATLTLNFSTLDRLDFGVRHVSGVADTKAFDETGNTRFRGNAYRFHSESAAVAREVAGVRGYRFTITRNTLTFEQSENAFFYGDYSGFEGEGAYLQPLSSNTRLAFGYLGTRYNHYDVTQTGDPNAIFRTETGDTGYVQFEGSLGPRQPYSVRLGWEQLRFNGFNDTASDFNGPVLDAKLSTIVGGGTTFRVSATRQPYRSFFQQNNFYVYERVGGDVERPFPHGSAFGASLDLSRNLYGEPAPTDSAAPGVIRHDQTFRFEAYANLAVGNRVYLRFSASKTQTGSNYPGADYNTVVLFGGFVFGWI